MKDFYINSPKYFDMIIQFQNKPIDFVNKTKAESRLEFAIGLLQKELNKIR